MVSHMEFQKTVRFPMESYGLVVGRQKSIERQTNTRIRLENMVRGDDPALAYIKGATEEQCNEAGQMILEIVSIGCRMPEKTISFPMEIFGLVVGRQGTTIQLVQRQTNTKITLEEGVNTALAHIRGATEEQCNEAEQMILDIVLLKGCRMPEKTISFPMEFFGLVVGSQGMTIKLVQRQTNTKINLEGGVNTALAHIRGATEEQCNKAGQMILEVVSKRSKRLAFVDGACVGEDNEFELEECQDDSNKLMYKLIMQGDKLDEPKEVDYLPMLEKYLLEGLREIYKENQESKKILTNIWCHFGHVYICNVDEDDVGKVYQIEDVIENLQKQEDNWRVEFKDGVDTPELVDLEKILSKEPCILEPCTRFEYSIRCPSGREVRFFAYCVNSNSDPVVSTVESREYMWSLHERHTYRLKVDICFPYLTFDCHFVVQTKTSTVKDEEETLKETSVKDEEETLKETTVKDEEETPKETTVRDEEETPKETTVRDEEEDQILIDFLDDNLKIKEGKLELQEDLLPDGFVITYWRESKLRGYPYKYDNVDFSVCISEEKSIDYMKENDVRTKTGILLRCKEWDELEEEWEPEAIVSKLPEFLNFVRAIQSNINP